MEPQQQRFSETLAYSDFKSLLPEGTIVEALLGQQTVAGATRRVYPGVAGQVPGRATRAEGRSVRVFSSGTLLVFMRRSTRASRRPS